MGWRKTIAKKAISYLLWTIAAFAIFYLIGASFNIVPQPIQDAISWTSGNFTTIAVMVCFLSALLIVERILNRTRGGN